MTRFCNKCSSPIIDENSLFCTKCGTKIISVTPKQVVQKPEVIQLCPACGAEIVDRNSPYCPNCLIVVNKSALGEADAGTSIENYPIFIGKDVSVDFCCEFLSKKHTPGERILGIIQGKAGVSYRNGLYPPDKPDDKNFYHFLIVTNFKILIVPVGYEHYDGDTFDFTPELNIDEYRELFFSEIRINNSGISARFRSKNKHDLASVLKIIQDQVNFRKKGLILLCPLRKFYKIRLEDRSVIYEYLGKYLTNQNDIRIGLIKLLHNQELEYPQNYPGIPFLKENSLEGVKGFYSAEYYERIQSVVRRSGSTEEMEQNIAFQKMVLDVGLFLTDLERLYHMFKKKSVQANYFIILDALKDLIDENESKKLNDLIDSLDDGISLMHRIISAKLGQQPEKAQIIREHIHLMNKYGKDLSEGNLPLILIEISKLLEKFHIRYNKAELNDLVSQAIDEEKLEEFEQNLGSPSEGDNELIPEDFHDMDGYEFEEFLLQVFERLGYSVLNTPLSGDQGADLVMVKDSEKTIVQAKHYSGSVPNKAIQEIVAAKNFYKAKYAMVVTSGNFSKSAFELARVNDVELWDGNQLADTIRKINEGRTRTFPSSINLNYKINGDDVQTFEVKCPVCDMVFEVTMNIRQDNEFECPACGIKMSTQKKSAD